MEKWKQIKGFENYSISDLGRVKNISTGRILKTRILDNGYPRVNLYSGRKLKTIYVHRIVIGEFKKYKEVNVIHKDENKENNSLCNLEYSDERSFSRPNNAIGKTVKNKITGIEFESISDASLKSGINYGNLSAMLSGTKKNTTNLILA